jgi:hypothetical protein
MKNWKYHKFLSKVSLLVVLVRAGISLLQALSIKLNYMTKLQRISFLIMCYIMLGLTALVWYRYDKSIQTYEPKPPTISNEQKDITTSLVEPHNERYEVIYETPKDLIIRLTVNSQVSTETALRIAECESNFGKYQTNWSGSSAYGLYQFTTSTWEHYCSGSRDSYIDQTNCFIKLYNRHPSWWSCK